MDHEHNPFAPPQADMGPPSMGAGMGTGFGGEADAIRRRFLTHESIVWTIGWLHLIGAAFMLLVVVMMVIMLVAGTGFFPQMEGGPPISLILTIITVIYGGMSMLYLWIGNGLRNLNNAARIGAIVLGILFVILCALGRNFIPILIQIAVLYFLACAKGSYVCSPEYHEIVRQTPYIWRKIWILVSILVFIGLGMVAMVALPILIISSMR